MAEAALTPAKVCSKCGVEKPLLEFGKQPGGRLGLKASCKSCGLAASRRWYATKMAGADPWIGQCEACGAEFRKASQCQRRCELCAAAHEKVRHRAKVIDRELNNKKCRDYALRNSDALKVKAAIRLSERKARMSPEELEEFKAAHRRVMTKRRAVNPLRARMSYAMRRALKGKTRRRHWLEALGYSIEDLRKHLQRQFLPGMTWENISEWHIDHILPQSSFEYETVDDAGFKACWALTNLRPLWAKDNIQKSAKRIFLI